MPLNLFPSRAPIGRATISGQQVDILMTPEFSRALADLFERVGGASSPSLTTVVQNLGSVTNIVQNISDDSTFVAHESSNKTDVQFLGIAPTLHTLEEKSKELRMLIELATSTLSDLDSITQQIQSFAIQSSFVNAPPSPLLLAPDATDLPTVITLANSLKKALLSNGIGS